MHIEGTYTLLAPPERVWHGMRDQQILRAAVPGMKQIELVDEQTFAISLSMDQEPFIGDCKGKITISEQQFPYHYRIAIQGTNEQGQFRGEVSIHLQDREESTIVAYTGTVHLTPSGQTSSTRLARGAAKLLIQQFFTALDDLLGTHDALDTDFAAVVERYDLYSKTSAADIKSKNGVVVRRDTSHQFAALTSEASPDPTASEQGGILSTLVHMLGLGHGEPEQEQIWTRRLRSAGTIAGLLFLVWLGTRLPRPRNRGERLPLPIDN